MYICVPTKYWKETKIAVRHFFQEYGQCIIVFSRLQAATSICQRWSTLTPPTSGVLSKGTPLLSVSTYLSWSRIHEHTIFFVEVSGHILRILKLENSVYNVYIKKTSCNPLLLGGGGGTMYILWRQIQPQSLAAVSLLQIPSSGFRVSNMISEGAEATTTGVGLAALSASTAPSSTCSLGRPQPSDQWTSSLSGRLSSGSWINLVSLSL